MAFTGGEMDTARRYVAVPDRLHCIALLQAHFASFTGKESQVLDSEERDARTIHGSAPFSSPNHDSNTLSYPHIFPALQRRREVRRDVRALPKPRIFGGPGTMGVLQRYARLCASSARAKGKIVIYSVGPSSSPVCVLQASSSPALFAPLPFFRYPISDLEIYILSKSTQR